MRCDMSIMHKKTKLSEITVTEAKERIVFLDQAMKDSMSELEAVKASSNDEYIVTQIEEQIDCYANEMFSLQKKFE